MAGYSKDRKEADRQFAEDYISESGTVELPRMKREWNPVLSAWYWVHADPRDATDPHSAMTWVEGK